MTANKLMALAEQLEQSAVSDAEDAINNMLSAERADRKFRIATALRARAFTQGNG